MATWQGGGKARTRRGGKREGKARASERARRGDEAKQGQARGRGKDKRGQSKGSFRGKSGKKANGRNGLGVYVVNKDVLRAVETT
ncbi:MAG: hypothetical protein R3Y63_12630 [Eubacteriales bacterium]